jgi:hypothetical protein
VIQALENSWNRGRSRGKATLIKNQLLFLLINGKLQERFFDLKLLPVIGRSGETIAFHESLTEITAQVLHERRQACIRRFCDLQVESKEDFHLKIIEILEEMSM